MMRRLAVAFCLALALGRSPSAAPVARPKVLLLVGQGPLDPGAQLLRHRLDARGYAVTVADAPSFERRGWAGQDAIIVSTLVDAAAADRLRSAELPLVRPSSTSAGFTRRPDAHGSNAGSKERGARRSTTISPTAPIASSS